MGDKTGARSYTYLGDQFSLSDEDAARGIITIGNPGSGKSSSVILPIIYDSMRLRQNLVITDPQLELRDKIIQLRRHKRDIGSSSMIRPAISCRVLT